MVTKVSGDTGVDKVQPDTISQEDLAANVVGKGPIFGARLTADQLLTNDIPSVLEFNKGLEGFGGINSWSTINKNFTAPVAGLYFVALTVVGRGTLTTSRVRGVITKNGNGIIQGSHGAYLSSSTLQASSAAGLVYLAAGDCIAASVVIGGTGSIYCTGGEAASNISGFLVRAA